MGHLHLRILPGTKKWRQVAELLGGEASTAEIVAASAAAAERDFEQAARDPVFVEAARLLALIPQAASSDDFAAGLRSLGLDVPADPLLFDLTTAAGNALDNAGAARGGWNDFAEVTRRALIATLTDQIGDRLPGLFVSEPGDVRAAVRALGRSPAFSVAARDFFSRVLSGSLNYYLSRALSAHVGPGMRFAGISDRSDFDLSLDQYCREASRIIKEFSGGWYGKTLYNEGTISHERAASFVYVVFKKIREEVRRKREADA